MGRSRFTAERVSTISNDLELVRSSAYRADWVSMQPRTGLGKIEKIGIIQEAPIVIAHEVCRVRTSYLLLALVHGLLQSWALSI